MSAAYDPAIGRLSDFEIANPPSDPDADYERRRQNEIAYHRKAAEEWSEQNVIDEREWRRTHGYPDPLPIAEQRAMLDLEPVSRARPSLTPAALMTKPATAEDWLVEGVLRPASVLVIAAAEGVGKSYVRLELAARLATGTGALFGHYPIPKPLTVACWDEENGDAEEYRREELVLSSLGLQRTDLGRYLRASFAGLDLTDQGSQAYIDEQIAANRPEVVMFDTGSSMVGDEWGGPIKAVMRYLRSLGVRYGTASVVTVHLTKPPRDTKGSTAAHGTTLASVMGQWTRSADAVALMSDLGDGRARWLMRKRVPPSSLVVRQDNGLWSVLRVGEESRSSSTDDRVLRAIVAGADRPDDLAEGLSIGKRTLEDAVRRLRRDGLLTNDFPYRATASGIERVSDE